MAKAIYFCHSNNIIHRDIKLENVMIRSDGSIKLIDFGYSLNVNSPKGSPSKFCGTPYYIPPEYLRKEAALGTIYITSV